MALKVCNTYQNEEDQNDPDQLLNQQEEQEEPQQQQRQELEKRVAMGKEAKELLNKILSVAKEGLGQDEQNQLLSQREDDENCWSEDELSILKAYCELESDNDEDDQQLLEEYITDLLKDQQ